MGFLPVKKMRRLILTHTSLFSGKKQVLLSALAVGLHVQLVGND